MTPKRTIVLILVCVILLPYLGKAKGRGRGSKWWGIAKVGEPTNLVSNSIKENSITNSYSDPAVDTTLRLKQRKFVKDNPGVIVAIAKGAKHAVSECKHQFKNRRWNCPTKDFQRGGRNLFGKIVDRGHQVLSGNNAKNADTLSAIKKCWSYRLEQCGPAFEAFF